MQATYYLASSILLCNCSSGELLKMKFGLTVLIIVSGWLTLQLPEAVEPQGEFYIVE